MKKVHKEVETAHPLGELTTGQQTPTGYRRENDLGSVTFQVLPAISELLHRPGENWRTGRNRADKVASQAGGRKEFAVVDDVPSPRL